MSIEKKLASAGFSKPVLELLKAAGYTSFLSLQGGLSAEEVKEVEDLASEPLVPGHRKLLRLLMNSSFVNELQEGKPELINKKRKASLSVENVTQFQKKYKISNTSVTLFDEEKVLCKTCYQVLRVVSRSGRILWTNVRTHLKRHE